MKPKCKKECTQGAWYRMPTNPRELLSSPSRVKPNRIRVASSAGTRAGEASSDLAVHPLCAGLHWPGELAPLTWKVLGQASKAGVSLEFIFPEF